MIWTDDSFATRGKIMASDAWSGLLDETGGRMSQLVVAGYDRPGTMTKSASAAFSKADIEKFKPDDDHFMVHYIAMGAGERYAFNRNGDYFSKKALQKYHPTFVTKAAYFREHQNRDKKKAIGIIKASAYNDEMDRVELLVHGDKRKAEKEYEKAKAGEELSGSMACTIPFDVCNICDKKSPRTSEYCDHAKRHMTRYMPEHRKYAYVDNPDPTFIDYSSVEHPADRIAHYISYNLGQGRDGMAKAASDGVIITSADWAGYYGGTNMPAELEDILHRMQSASRELNYRESVKCATARSIFIRDVVPAARGGELDDNDLATLRRLRPATLFNELNKRASIMPFATFCAYITGHRVSDIAGDPVFKQAKGNLHHTLEELTDGDARDSVAGMVSQFSPASEAEAATDPENGDAVDRILDKAEPEMSLREDHLHRRALSHKVEPVKEASVILLPADASIDAMASAYISYKAACMASLDGLYGRNEARDLLIAGIM